MSSLLNRVRRLELAHHDGGGGTYGCVVRSGSPSHVRQVLDWIQGLRRRNPNAWIYIANLARSPDLSISHRHPPAPDL